MNESKVESHLRAYLKKEGWRRKDLGTVKRPGEHGVDIKAHHPKLRRALQVEVKGGARYQHQAFYALLGQILSRMDKKGNSSTRARIYAIGIPSSWAGIFQKKIRKMKHGWSLIRPRVYVVKPGGDVDDYSYTKFYKASF